MNERPVRRPRAEPREILELRELRVSHPELTSAIDLQIELVEVQRRIQSRVPLPWIQPDPAWMAAQQRAGRPVVRFEDIPLEWTDFRLALRQTADALKRFDALEQADYQEILGLLREGNAIEPLVTRWYLLTSGVQESIRNRTDHGVAPGVEQALLLAFRPFLARCTEALAQRDLSTWRHNHCPYCGWEPDFAVITPSGERHLICGRCLGHWAFDSIACPYCTNDNRSRITSFATRDGRYRVSGCDVCRRYLKAYDARNAARPVMMAVDSIATLPLDAAAMQKGYSG
ncbi:MAG: formate dehydrogenase accessory protein FdhE [Vicinamibacterales bacterium]